MVTSHTSPHVKGRVERVVTRVLTFAAFLGLGFLILRYVIGAGHTLAWSLAYIDAVVSISIVDLKDRLDRRP
jgi:hypothetical protein